MKESTKILFKGAIINCGIATALINGIISYFTLMKAGTILSSDLMFNFFSTALGCGVICPFFGGLILKGVSAKNQIAFGEKKEQLLARFIPDNIFLGAVLIGIFTIIALWLVPYALIAVLKIKLTLARFFWVIIIALYSGAAASFAAYFGMKRAHYAA